MSGFQMAQAPQYANPPPPAVPVAAAPPAGPVASTASIATAAQPGAPVQAQATPQTAPQNAAAAAAQPAGQGPNPFDQFDAPVQAQGAPAPANPFDQFDPTPAQLSPGYQQAKAAQAPAPNMQGAAAIGDQIVNGLTFNNADRIGGALSAAGQYVHNLFTGPVPGQPSPSQAYAATRDQIDQEDGQFQAAHPVASVAANLAGGLPIGAGAAKVVSLAPGLIAKGLAAEGAGVGLGAAYGAGANKANPGQGAITGGAEGAVLAPVVEAAGPVLGAVGTAVNNAFRPGALEGSAQQRAAQYLENQMAQNVATTNTNPVAQAASRPLTPGEQAAAATLTQRGIAPAGVVTAMQTPVANGGLTVAETLGQQGTGMLAGMTRKPGIAGDLANNVLGARQAGRTDRLVSAVAQATGVDPTLSRAYMASDTKAAQVAVSPKYAAIMNQPGAVYSPALAQIASRPVIRSAAKQAYTDMLNQGKNPEDFGLYQPYTPASQPPLQIGQDGNRLNAPTGSSITVPTTGRSIAPQSQAVGFVRPQPVPDIQTGNGADDIIIRGPTAATWDLIKKAAGRQVDRSPLTGAPLPDSISPMNYGISKATGDLTSALKDAIPGYEEALGDSADYLTNKSTFDNARGLLFGGTANKTPYDVQTMYGSLGTPGAQQAMKRAFAADIQDRADRGILQPADFLSPGVKQKMNTVFGSDATDHIVNTAQNEQNMSKFAARVMPNSNSITAEAGNYGDKGLRQAFLAGAQKAGGHLLEGDPHRGAFAVAAHAAKYLMSVGKANSDIAFRNALAEQYLGDASSFVPNSLRSAPKTGISVAPMVSNAAVQGLNQQQGNNQ